jgi:hypothetical protein
MSIFVICSIASNARLAAARIARQQIGYLLNFGKKGELQWKRFIVTDLHSSGEEENTNRH